MITLIKKKVMKQIPFKKYMAIQAFLKRAQNVLFDLLQNHVKWDTIICEIAVGITQDKLHFCKINVMC